MQLPHPPLWFGGFGEAAYRLNEIFGVPTQEELWSHEPDGTWWIDINSDAVKEYNRTSTDWMR